MQRSILALFGVFTVLLCLASLALASDDEVFRSQMICDTDGLAPFTDVRGTVSIFDNGKLQVLIRRLRPNTTYTCQPHCLVGDLFAVAPCLTNARGTLNALLPGLGRSCGQPVVTIFVDDPDDLGDFCESGYGSP
jgi:hypothetical protein